MNSILNNPVTNPIDGDIHEVGFLVGLVATLLLVLLGFFILQFSLLNFANSREASENQDYTPIIEATV